MQSVGGVDGVRGQFEVAARIDSARQAAAACMAAQIGETLDLLR